jgi:hypothetical protein
VRALLLYLEDGKRSARESCWRRFDIYSMAAEERAFPTVPRDRNARWRVQ